MRWGAPQAILHHFDDLEDVAHRLVPLLAVLHGQQAGQLVEVLFDQGFQPEEHLHALAHRRVGPAGKAAAAAWIACSTSAAVHCGA